MDILGPDRGKITIYGSDFQQVNLTPNGVVSPTVLSEASLGWGKSALGLRPDRVGTLVYMATDSSYWV